MANEKMKDYQTDHDAWKKALPDATPELSPTAAPVTSENLTKSGEPKKKPGPKPKSTEAPKPVRSPWVGSF
jgi:biotin carboxyl carrier protein